VGNEKLEWSTPLCFNRDYLDISTLRILNGFQTNDVIDVGPDMHIVLFPIKPDFHKKRVPCLYGDIHNKKFY
jgi:hypothetical protein